MRFPAGARRTVTMLAGLTLGVTGCTEGPAAVGPSPGPPTSTATGAPRTERPLDPDTIFAGTGDVVWREHAGQGNGPFANEDATLAAGFYQLAVACRGGVLAVTVNGGRAQAVDCANEVAAVPVCLRAPGLRVFGQWSYAPHGEVAWQLVRMPGACR